MKICISVNGCFHAMKLAFQLQQRGYLQRIITTYPKFYTRKYHLQNSLVKSFFILEILKRFWQKLPTKIKNSYSSDALFATLFDHCSAQCIPKDCDIFVGWSGSALYSLKKARKQGAITILERGSSHILFQKKILEEEYLAYGIATKQIVHPTIVERELAEYQIADYIAIPSSFVKQTFIDYGIPEKKLLVTPYGADLENFYVTEKKDNVFRIIYCGSQSLRKGLHYLLQAFYELNLPDSELCLIGSASAEMSPFLKKYAHTNIKQLGSFPEAQLVNYYGKGSVFCLPSIEEGLAMVTLQAMACGLPVICSTNTGAQDIITDNKEGFTIPIRNIEILKEKIVFFYENAARRKEMGIQARKTIEQHFTWEQYGNKAINQYLSLNNRSTSCI